MLKTARHEAGHALISWLSGDKPTYVTVVSRSNYGGYMRHSNQEDRLDYSRPELLSRVRASLGGRAAEIVYYGKENGVTTGASSDLANATELVRRMLCAYGMDEGFGLAASTAYPIGAGFALILFGIYVMMFFRWKKPAAGELNA